MKARVRLVRYRNSSLTDSKAKLMHLVVLHLLLSVLFLNHTLQHNGGVGKWMEASAGASVSQQKQAIQSEHCLAKTHDKR